MAGYWVELAQKMAEAARARVAEERRKLETFRLTTSMKPQLEQTPRSLR